MAVLRHRQNADTRPVGSKRGRALVVGYVTLEVGGVEGAWGESLKSFGNVSTSFLPKLEVLHA